MRTAILPFVFIFNTELLMISGVAEDGSILWLDDWVQILVVFATSLLAMFAFAAAVQGWFARRLNVAGRILLGIVCLFLFLPGIAAGPAGFPEAVIRLLAVGVMAGFYFWQRIALMTIR